MQYVLCEQCWFTEICLLLLSYKQTHIVISTLSDCRTLLRIIYNQPDNDSVVLQLTP